MMMRRRTNWPCLWLSVNVALHDDVYCLMIRNVSVHVTSSRCCRLAATPTVHTVYVIDEQLTTHTPNSLTTWLPGYLATCSPPARARRESSCLYLRCRRQFMLSIALPPPTGN